MIDDQKISWREIVSETSVGQIDGRLYQKQCRGNQCWMKCDLHWHFGTGTNMFVQREDSSCNRSDVSIVFGGIARRYDD